MPERGKQTSRSLLRFAFILFLMLYLFYPSKILTFFGLCIIGPFVLIMGFLAEPYWDLKLIRVVTLSGVFLNELAVISNGLVMPVDKSKWPKNGFLLDARHTLLTDKTHLKFLCDIYPFHIGMFSIGDFILISSVILSLLLRYIHKRKETQWTKQP